MPPVVWLHAAFRGTCLTRLDDQPTEEPTQVNPPHATPQAFVLYTEHILSASLQVSVSPSVSTFPNHLQQLGASVLIQHGGWALWHLGHGQQRQL